MGSFVSFVYNEEEKEKKYTVADKRKELFFMHPRTRRATY
jgi:O-phosphoseryl-tRNA(Cys) synthetase